jgi:outer membrane protein
MFIKAYKPVSKRAYLGQLFHLGSVNLLFVLFGLFVAAHSACATDLMEVWRAAQLHDLDYSAAIAGHKAGTAKEAEANALWRPSVQLTGTAGRMSSETATRGAQFSAPPGFPTTNGVAFNTSVNNGSLDRWALSARQPLISGDRSAQSRQLHLHVEASDLEWLNARQSLILRTAERYFDGVLAQESLLVFRHQAQSIDKSLGEIKSRFKLGEVPVTDSHEATARMQTIQAQVLSAEADMQLKLAAIADATGIAPDKLTLMKPTGTLAFPEKNLDAWLGESALNNLELRMKQSRVDIAREESKRYGALASSSLDLVGEVSRDHLSGSGDFGAASNTGRNALLGIQFTLPLYTGGYRSARQDESIALAEISLHEYERTRQQIALQTRAAWLGMTVGFSRVEALAASLKANEARLAATKLGHKVGDRTTLDVLNAENDAANARLSWMQASIALVMDRLRLAALTGKLEEDQLQIINGTLQVAEFDGDMRINASSIAPK